MAKYIFRTMKGMEMRMFPKLENINKRSVLQYIHRAEHKFTDLCEILRSHSGVYTIECHRAPNMNV
jgi:hypothetical protein